jgi:hypothetical protein
MKRQIIGLHAADRAAADKVPDGVFLTRVHKVYFRREARKPYHTVSLAILKPVGSLAAPFPVGCIAARKLFGS